MATDYLLSGLRAVVVGATGCIGSETVRYLAACGAQVVAVGRSSEALAEVAPVCASALNVELSSPMFGTLVADAVERTLGGVDLVVNAAGGLGSIGPTRAMGAADLLSQFTIGVAASAELVRACGRLLDQSGSPSVVLFSGGGSTDVFPRFTPYAIDKVATVRYVENLAAEEPRWKVNAVAPGFVVSNIHQATFSAGQERAGDYHQETIRRIETGGVPPAKAARLVAFLGSSVSEGISGRLISAPWDDWESETGRTAWRESSSLGRLRRIDRQWFTAVSKDRAQ